MKKLWDLKKDFSNLDLEGQGRGIIIEVTHLLLLGPFYTIETKKDQTFWRGVYLCNVQTKNQFYSKFICAIIKYTLLVDVTEKLLERTNGWTLNEPSDTKKNQLWWSTLALVLYTPVFTKYGPLWLFFNHCINSQFLIFMYLSKNEIAHFKRILTRCASNARE